MKKLAKEFQENKCFSWKQKLLLSRDWEDGDKWSFSKSIEKEPPSWGSANTRQIKLRKVVERNKEENQTTTPTIHEITNSSRGNSFDGTRDGLKSCRDRKKKRLKHHQKIITKVDAKIDFRNKEIKVFRNEQLNMYEELKGMEKVLHQWEEELNTQLTAMENVRENHHKDWTLLVENEKKLWKESQVAQGKVELFILQIANDWENMATVNKTKATLHDEFVKQLPIKMGELLEKAKT